jgi:serine/threonine protein kinase
MRSRHNPIYRLLNRDYHESFDLYTPRSSDFYDLISKKLPAGWDVKRRGIWFQCSSPGNIPPEQGWKIHVSATRAEAGKILDRVSSLLFAAAENSFKFALDSPTLFLLNSKSWPRGGSGKFITIYPRDNRQFLELIEQLHAETRDFRGPYILSDHRYKDSNVVFYRYGGMRLRDALDATGERSPVLVGPDGTEVPDRRLAYPVTPEWAEAVLPPQDTLQAQQDSYDLGQGRYQIEDVIAFSSAGGIYRGTDGRTGASVVIKEARPCIETSDGIDAVALLKKEHRLLALLADSGIAPQPVDLFEEGTHWFLVEEYINGIPLSSHSAAHNILLRTRPAEEDYELWYQVFRKIALRVIDIVDALHSRNVVFADLSPNNLIITNDSNDLKLVDFEGAYQEGIDQPVNLYTPGFVSQSRLQGSPARREDDYYSVGAVLLSYLLPVNGLFHLKPEAKEEFLDSIQRDARLPATAAKLILALMRPKTAHKPSRATIAEMLPPACANTSPAFPSLNLAQDCSRAVDGVVDHILQAATYSRTDRLFPADPKLFSTNPLSLAHGAAGVAYALKKITGSTAQPVVDWILGHRISDATYAPGLYMGISGIAWSLLEIGEIKEAERLFQLTFDHRLLNQSLDLFYGLTGWGLTNLRFFLETGNELYLQKAVSCAHRFLDKSGVCSLERFCEDPGRPLGLAHGASGIALFLLYLYLVTGEEGLIAAGRKALARDLAAGVETKDGGLAWSAALDARRALYSYWRYGSAGVGSAVVRYYHVLGDGSYRQALEKIFIDTDRKYATLPGCFVGLAGIGNFLLDAWSFTGERKYFESAQKVAQGVLKFKVNRQGVAFPGDFLSRLCCDYGTGSAGIALFLNRLLTNHAADFLLDGRLGLCQLQPAIPVPGQRKHIRADP